MYWALLLAGLAALPSIHGAEEYALPSDLPLDETGRLASHLLLLPKACESVLAGLHPSGVRQHILVENESPLALAYWPMRPVCESVVCLEKGTRAELVPHHFTMRPLGMPLHNIDTWVTNTCDKVEIAFASNVEEDLDLFWVRPGGDAGDQERLNGQVRYGEKKIFWIWSFLGHTFRVRSKGGELVAEFEVQHSGVHVVGEKDSKVGSRDVGEEEVRRVLNREWKRAQKVTKIFTEKGFGKGRLPPATWGSIDAYYYNNRGSFVREAWDVAGGIFVNWWESEVDILIPPWTLKKRWQRELMPMVQRFFNSGDLEPTDIYGLRRYTNGSRLLMHVDREATHALSLIINVDQINMLEDWHVEINSHNEDLHEIAMQPGDVVYYESAACLHGRMRPLLGDGYVNLFSHYRPRGDDLWYTRDGGLNEEEIARTDEAAVRTMTGADDLFARWKDVERPKTLMHEEL